MEYVYFIGTKERARFKSFHIMIEIRIQHPSVDFDKNQLTVLPDAEIMRYISQFMPLSEETATRMLPKVNESCF